MRPRAGSCRRDRRMKTLSSIFVSVLALGFAGCSMPSLPSLPGFGGGETRVANREAEEAKLPFRWKTKKVGKETVKVRVMLPLKSGASLASPAIKRDIMDLIRNAENAQGRVNPQVEDVKLMEDGREVWILRASEGGIAYIVFMRPSKQGGGGTQVELGGPYPFEKGKA